MRIHLRDARLTLKVPFAISRNTTEVRAVCIAEIDHEGVKGYGEASPSAYCGDSREKAREAIVGAGEVLGDDPFAIRRISEELYRRFPGSPSGRAAVEMALWDVAGKLSGLPVFKIFGLSGRSLPRTSLTVGVTDVDVARGMIDSLRRVPILKVKVGFGDEEALLSLLKQNTEAVLRVDANEGWSLDEAIEKTNAYRDRFSIEIFEQPLPKDDIDGYRRLRQATDATIIVDESVLRKEDVARWQDLVDGVNIKLMKCGGLIHAAEIASVAGALGMKVMLGCMIESSLAITAAAHIASLADYCDLDGNLLISDDPFTGVKAEAGVLTLSDEPGLGVAPRKERPSGFHPR